MPKVDKNNKDKETLKRVQAYLATEHGYCSKDLNKEPENFSPNVVKTEASDVKLNKKCSRKDILDDYEVVIEQPGHTNNEEPEVFQPDNIVQFNGDEPLMDPISYEVKIEPLDDEVETPVFSDISEHPLETPLHPKAKRRRTSRQTNVKCSSSATSSPASEMKSPASPAQPRHTARNNIGSDEDTDESDGEDMLVLPIIPRVFRTTLRTSSDLDLDSDDEDFAPKPASSCDPGLKAEEYEFDWRPFSEVQIPPQSRREPFSQINVGPTTPLVDPYDLFVAIWDRAIMEHIAFETNRYAQELAARKFEENTLRPNSRIRSWQDTTADELYVFFAIILAMGVVIKSKTEEYWTSNIDIFYTPGFSAHMSYNRFVILSQCLHFNNNVKLCALNLGPSKARVFNLSSPRGKCFSTKY